MLRHNHFGPLRVQRPFYPEGAVNHTYLLHPPGGLVGDDQLCIDASIHGDAHALITTPGATKAYRNICHASLIQQHLQVAGTLEWLPQEIILFDGSKLNSHTTVDLASDARLVMWEVQCFGRPAGDLPYLSGEANFKLSIQRQGKPLFDDTLRVAGGQEVMYAPWGLDRHSALGVMLAYPGDDSLCASIREMLNDTPAAAESAKASVTLLNGLLVIRVLHHQAQHIRRIFVDAWRHIRPHVLERSASVPRIWNT